MPFTVALVEHADIPTIATIQWAALRDNSLSQTLYPRGFTPELANFTRASYEKASTYPSVRMIKATDDESGQIVAFAKWIIYKHGRQGDDSTTESHGAGKGAHNGAEEGWRKGKVGPQQPPHCYTRVLDDWNRRITTMRKSVVENRRHFCQSAPEHSLSCYFACYSTNLCVLDILHTHPSQQGKGAGARLVEWGTDMADKEGVQCYVETPVVGYALFRQSGFRTVTEMRIDLGKYKDGFTEYKHVVMIRPPLGTLQSVQPPAVPPKSTKERQPDLTERESVWETVSEADMAESPTLQYTAEARMLEMRSSTSTGSPKVGSVAAMRATASMGEMRSSTLTASRFASISDVRSSSLMKDVRTSLSTQPGSVRNARASMMDIGDYFLAPKPFF